MNPAEALAAAMRHHQAGQLADAAQLYAQALAGDPNNLQALILSGAIAHTNGRNDDAVALFGRALAINEQPDLHYNIGLAKWSLGQKAEAATHWSRAIVLNPNFPAAHMNLGNALREAGRLDEAVTHLRQALQLQPSPFAHNNLGLALAARGDPQAAINFRRAIEMHPNFVEPYLNLALDLSARGDTAQALGLVQRSLEIAQTPENQALFVRLASGLESIGEDPQLRALATRAATEGWDRGGDLSALAATLTKHGSAIENLIRQADRTLGLPELSAIAADPLLRWLLEVGVICDLELERFLTATRASLVRLAETEPESLNDDLLRFACGLARQCFINEYVYATSDDELARAKGLCAAVIPTLGTGMAVPRLQIAVVAAYFPLPIRCWSDPGPPRSQHWSTSRSAGPARKPPRAPLCLASPRSTMTCRAPYRRSTSRIPTRAGSRLMRPSDTTRSMRLFGTSYPKRHTAPRATGATSTF
jgi:tetratricopeptide (TPR) repeat protein